MQTMEIQESTPRCKTSRCRIKYRPSTWCKHSFEVWSGELICKVAVVRMKGSMLVWIGGAGDPELSELALGVPALGRGDAGRGAVATSLLGAEGPTTSMVRRLAVALRQPVYIACGSTFDRFTLPLVERGLITEIKNSQDCCNNITLSAGT